MLLVNIGAAAKNDKGYVAVNLRDFFFPDIDGIQLEIVYFGSITKELSRSFPRVVLKNHHLSGHNPTLLIF
jgi:hypothetical protein